MIDQTRRDVMKRAGVVGAAGVLSSTALLSASEPALAASGFTANDVNITTSDGKLNTLTINPDITIDWSDQGMPVATVEVTWKVSTSSTSETTIGNTPYSFDVAEPTTSGSFNQTISEISMLSNNGGALDASNFEATTDGGSNTTNVTISMDCTLKDSNDNIITSATDLLGPNTYSVTITNGTSSSPSISGSGTANTGGS
ncbi:hypothetical protein DJ69_09320 [Halorubrum persicum]|uniref:Twin-arginine translocation signal domain-containing protein n=1 Tax=Halorubrum persicum TaxID=1383844 RepID=A0A2G1WJ56_9EURY|nr:twin-arginine translocation signal domain-containing protein [Halorubrum persicum]PHQ38869.1 hypothetical protein DJ69_09320 [Halorubrum persicum]